MLPMQAGQPARSAQAPRHAPIPIVVRMPIRRGSPRPTGRHRRSRPGGLRMTRMEVQRTRIDAQMPRMEAQMMRMGAPMTRMEVPMTPMGAPMTRRAAQQMRARRAFL